MRDNQYRLLWTGISTSKKINGCQAADKWRRAAIHLTYTWLLPWADDEGRLRGESLWVLANILPNSGFTTAEIEKFLEELDRVQLIKWYSIDGEKFIEIQQFNELQHIRKDRFKASIYPPCGQTADNLRTNGCQLVDTCTTYNDHKDKDKDKEACTKNFLEFYDAYPNRKEKPQVLKTWQKLRKEGKLPELPILITAIEKQKKWRAEANGEFRPEWKHPATWLNKGCWEDETTTQEGADKSCLYE